MKAACETFWSNVQAREAELLGMPAEERMEALNEMLVPPLEELVIEVEGDDDDPRYKLVLSADGIVERFEPLMALAGAPPSLASIEVVAFRQRTAEGFGMRMQDFELATGDVLVRHMVEDGKVALEIAFAKAIPMDMRDHAQHMAFIMLDHVLGEYDFAVKVGTVDFAGPDAPFDGVSLDDFVPLFDACWRDTLGHTGVRGLEDSWRGLEAVRDVDGREVSLLVHLNNAANGLVARADLAYHLQVDLEVSSREELDLARALEDALAAQMDRHDQGVLTHVVLEGSLRSVHFQVADGEAALAAAQAVASREAPSARCALDFDPRWDAYCRWLQ